jgi:hypothetical protein
MPKRTVPARNLRVGQIVLAPLGRLVQPVEITRPVRPITGRSAVRLNGVTASGQLVELDVRPDGRFPVIGEAY